MKVALVLDDTLDSTDGVAQYVLGIGQWLREQGHEVHYLVGETHRSDIAHIHSLSRNLKVRYNGNRMSTPLPANKQKIRKLLRKENFDVLHIQMPYSPLMAQRIIMAAPKQTVIVGTFHVLPYSGLVTFGNKLLGISLQGSLKRFDKIFAVSPAAKLFAEQLYSAEADVLPNVVEVARFKNAKPLPQYSDTVLTIMFLGRLVPRKGAMTLLEAAKILISRNKLPKFRVVICGKGPLDAALKHFVRNQGLDQLVEFTGFVPEDIKPDYIASADIMVYPSSGGESFGIVLLEAFAAGATVLAGDNPGYRSVLEPKPELLFDPGNPVELARKLEYFMMNPVERNRISRWEQSYVQQFDTAAVAGRLVTSYRKLLQEKHSVR